MSRGALLNWMNSNGRSEWSTNWRAFISLNLFWKFLICSREGSSAIIMCISLVLECFIGLLPDIALGRAPRLLTDFNDKRMGLERPILKEYCLKFCSFQVEVELGNFLLWAFRFFSFCFLLPLPSYIPALHEMVFEADADSWFLFTPITHFELRSAVFSPFSNFHFQASTDFLRLP